MCVCVRVCVCACVYTYIYIGDFLSEGIDGPRVTQLRFERNICFCYDTSLLKVIPRSGRPGLDT